MKSWSRAKIYVAFSRAYILGHLPEAERQQLREELNSCLTSLGETNYREQQTILRREANALWEFKQAYQALLDVDSKNGNEEQNNGELASI